MKAAPPSSHPGPAAPSSASDQGTPADGAPLLNIANALTVLRIGLVPAFVWLMLQPGDSMRLAAAIVFMVAAATDRLDGQLARSRNLITSFGKIADPIADKALTLSAFILLSVAGRLWWWVTVLIIVRELGITVMRFAMLRRAVMAASRGGKIKTVLQILALVGLLLPWHAVLPAVAAAALLRLSYALVAAALVVTVATGIDYVLQAIRISRENSAAGAADGARHG